MYKIETHMHTKPISTCAHLTPEEIIPLYKESGYDTLFISDHFAAYHFDQFPDLSWQEKTALLYDCYLHAKTAGEALGMHVLFSPEFSIGANHYLLYNADLDFLNSREDFFQLSLEEFRAHCQSHGIIMVQAHPYRDEKSVPTPAFVDAIEAYNGHVRHDNYNEKAYALAEKYGLPISAGSDAHRVEDVGTAAMLSPYEIKSTEDYLRLLFSGEGTILKSPK